MHSHPKIYNQKFPGFLPSSQKQLTRLHISCRGTIEDDGYGMLQVRNPLISMVHLQKPPSAFINAECVQNFVMVLRMAEGVLECCGKLLNIFACFKNVVMALPLHTQLTSMVVYAPYAPSQSLQLAGLSLSVAPNSSRKLGGGALTFGVSSLYTSGWLAHLLFNKWFQKIFLFGFLAVFGFWPYIHHVFFNVFTWILAVIIFFCAYHFDTFCFWGVINAV